MTRSQMLWMTVIALAAGLTGGVLGGRILPREPLLQEGDPKRAGIVVAGEIHLVDEEGKDRWVLALSKNGEPSMTFVNHTGWAPMALGINQDGLPYINMVLEPSREGGPSLVLMDSRMKARARLGMEETGEPSLVMFDKEGRRRLILGSGEFAPYSLALLDGDGKRRHSLP